MRTYLDFTFALLLLMLSLLIVKSKTLPDTISVLNVNKYAQIRLNLNEIQYTKKKFFITNQEKPLFNNINYNYGLLSWFNHTRLLESSSSLLNLSDIVESSNSKSNNTNSTNFVFNSNLSKNKSLNAGVIIGIIIGSSVILFIIIFSSYRLIKHCSKKDNDYDSNSNYNYSKSSKSKKQISFDIKIGNLNKRKSIQHKNNPSNNYIVENEKKLEIQKSSLKEAKKVVNKTNELKNDYNDEYKNYMNNNKNSEQDNSEDKTQRSLKLKKRMEDRYVAASKSFSKILIDSTFNNLSLFEKSGIDVGSDETTFRHTDSKENPSDRITGKVEKKNEKDTYINGYAMLDKIKKTKLNPNSFILNIIDKVNEN